GAVTAALAHTGGPLACAGLTCLYLAPVRSWRLAGLGALVLGSILLGPEVAPHAHRTPVAAAVAAGVVLAAGGSVLLVRWPWLLALGTLASLPVRVPVRAGTTTANLLAPAYVVVVAGVVALVWVELRGPPRAGELSPLPLPPRPPLPW